MKKKFIHRFSVLFLALIIAVAPLIMALPVSANSDVLVGSDSPVLDGYDLFYFTSLDMPVYLALPSGLFDLEIPMVLLLSNNFGGTQAGYLFGSFNIDLVDNLVKFSALGHSNRVLLSSSLEQYEFGAVLFVSVETSEFDSNPLTLDVPGIQHVYITSHVDVETPLPYSYSYYPSPPVPGVLSVFSGVGSWLAGAVQSASTMFWTAETGMTVLGYLAVASLAFAVILLIFYLIAGWLKFR